MANLAVEGGLAAMAYARSTTIRLLEVLPEDQYLHQPIPEANHALWIVGHLAYADDLFLGSFDVRPHKLPEKWHTEFFGEGSTPKPDASAYPSVAEVTERFTALRVEIIGWFEGMSAEKLASPLPDDWLEVGPTFMNLMGALACHESLHAGQLTLVRKSLGFAPVDG